MKKLLVLVVAIWCITLVPTHAFGLSNDDIAPIAEMSGATAITAPFAVANFVYIGKGYKPPAVWRIGGYVSGTVDCVFGLGGIISNAIFAPIHEPPQDPTMGYIAGGVMLAVGAVTIVSAALTEGLPTQEQQEKQQVQVGVAPILLRDSNNALAGGVGLSVVGW